MTEIPKFKIPFQIGPSGSAYVVEQDSDEEVVQCVTSIVSTVKGTRVEQPEFGVPDPTFRQGGPDLETYRQAIADWEPRAAAIVSGAWSDEELTTFITDIKAGSKSDG